MIAAQLRRMLRWQKLQRFRATPEFYHALAYSKALRRAYRASF